MSIDIRITGKVTAKRYQCSSCKKETMESTNHYGEFYRRCEACSWKSPMDPIKTFVCLEPLPEGWGKPPPWKTATLGDVVTVVTPKT